MDTDRDRHMAGLMLFLLGGLAGTALALRWSRRGEAESVGSALQGLHAILDDTVTSVETMVGTVRRMASPLHEVLEEASGLAAGVHRTLDSYRSIGRSSSESSYVPSMAPEGRGAIPTSS